MNFVAVAIFLFAHCALAQDAEAIKPDTVLATYDDGHKTVTSGELNAYLNEMPAQQKQLAMADRRQMISQFILFKRIIEYANSLNLAEESPYKESIANARMLILSNAGVNRKYLDILVTAEDQKKYYAEHPDKYTQVKVKALYLGFVSDPVAARKETPGKTYRSEREAKEQLDSLRARIHSQEDFVRLAKENSEDEPSRSKNGEFGTLKRSDKLPDDIQRVVFSMKAGELSQPLRQATGYWMFFADSVGLRDYESVRDSIYVEIKEQRFRQWMDQETAKPFKVENESFFAGPAGTPKSK